MFYSKQVEVSPWFEGMRGIKCTISSSCWCESFDTLKPIKKCCRFADDILKPIFLNKNYCVLIQTPLKFVCHGPVDINPASVQTMVCRLIGDKPLSTTIITVQRCIYATQCEGWVKYGFMVRVSKEKKRNGRLLWHLLIFEIQLVLLSQDHFPQTYSESPLKSVASWKAKTHMYACHMCVCCVDWNVAL